MPLDPLITNGIRPVDVEPYGAAAGRAMSLRGMFQHQQAGKLSLDHATRQADREKLAIADDAKYRETWAKHGGDTKAVLADLFSQGNPRAFELQKTMDEREKAGTALKKDQLANAKETAAQVSAGLNAVKSATDPAQKIALYSQLRASMIQRGLAKAEEVPEQYDPVYVDSQVAQGFEIDKQIAAAQKALEIAETGRHHKAGEAHQTATLGETTRHNKHGEALNVAQLAETGRHNRTGEFETGRHNKRSEGLTAAQLAETGRHNKAAEGTAAIAAAKTGNPTTEKYRDRIISINNLRDSLKSYDTELNGGSARFPGTEGYAKLQSRFTDLQMKMKDLYSLGAITGPDLELMNNALTDPTTLRGYRTSNDALKAQLAVFTDVLKKAEDNVNTVYGGQPRQPQYSAPTNGITVDTSKVSKVDLSGAKTEDLLRMLTSGGK